MPLPYSQDSHVLISGTWTYVALYGKKDFIDGVKVINFRKIILDYLAELIVIT